MSYSLDEQIAQSHYPNGHVRAAAKRYLRIPNMSMQPLAVFFLAFIVRLGFVLALEHRLYWPDEIAFDKIALDLLNGEGYQSRPFRANPVLPFFLAVVYKVFGHSYIAPRIIQSFIGALTACIIFALSAKMFNKRVAFLAGLGVAVYPPVIYISGVFYVSCLETFLVAFSIYLLYTGSQHENYQSFIFLPMAGIAIGIAALCRPVSLALLPFAVLFVVLSYRGSALRRVAYVMALMLVTFLTVLPWTLRNHSQYGRFLMVSTGGGLFLWKGNNELARGDTADRYLEPGVGDVWMSRLTQLEPGRRSILIRKYDIVQRDVEGLDEIDRDRYLQTLALAFIAQHPAQFLGLFVRKIWTLYTAFTEVRPENEELVNKKTRTVFSFIFYPLLLLGLFGTLATLNEWRKYLVLYVPIVSLTFAYALLAAASRFRIPLEPFIIVFASHGVLILWGRFRHFEKAK
jgi:4-amino-4-deoxy-L-arabinose transferase-like glycosyltransferase